MSTSNRCNMRKRMWEEQGGCCYWCGRETVLPVAGSTTQFPHTATYDHLVPKSHGGKHSDDNGVVACKECNTKRGCRASHPLTRVRFDPKTLLQSHPRTSGMKGTALHPGEKPKGSKQAKRKNTAYALGRPVTVAEFRKLLACLPQDQFLRFGTPHGEFKLVLGLSGTTGEDHSRIEVE